jgi:transposase
MSNLVYIGLDVGKFQLSCSLPGSKPFDIVNDPAGIGALLRRAKELAPPEQLCFVMESTGEYSTCIAETLLELAATHVAIVPPACINGFKQAGLTRTKNDHVDAVAIREFAAVKQPAPWLSRSLAERRLRSLQLVMHSLRQSITQQKCLSEKLESGHRPDPCAQACIDRVIVSLENEFARIQQEFDKVVAADEALARDSELMLSIPGIGPVVRNVVLAVCYQQLHTLPQRKLLAHCGMSPREQQSGQHRGRTLMSKTGDARIRRALYMAALVVIRKGGLLHEYYQRHKTQGKPGKVIIVSVMRKLLYLIQGVVRSQTPFNPVRAQNTA